MSITSIHSIDYIVCYDSIELSWNKTCSMEIDQLCIAGGKRMNYIKLTWQRSQSIEHSTLSMYIWADWLPLQQQQ